jgi:hypothetical protein
MGRRIYFDSWFQRVRLWLLGPTGLGRTSWQEEHEAEESYSLHGGQEVEREYRKGTEQDIPPRMGQ